MKYRNFNSVFQRSMIIISLLCIYSGHILYNILVTNAKRKLVQVGDVCSVYIGERKLRAYVIKVNPEVDVLVLNKVFRLERNQLYA